MNDYLGAVRNATLTRKLGSVRQLSAQSLHAWGPDVAVGTLCEINCNVQDQANTPTLLAEVVGLRPGGLTVLMPYGSVQGVRAGDEVRALGDVSEMLVGPGLVGRVVNGWGETLDKQGPLEQVQKVQMSTQAPPPMTRTRIEKVLPTGVRAIDTLLPIGCGQRMGIFAGSGVGKSTLLGMIAQNARADVNVIALIGERGREVRDFIERHLGADGMARSVVVVATADEPAVMRLRATHYAVAVAEHFRNHGHHVLLTLDSITRYAMARREVGLAAGEPPTARGYTPSVFTDIARLCERCGTQEAGGIVTALMTVLVEGDDMNDPIADCLRATLDGHIVLTRTIAHTGRFPAVDVLHSTSRLMPQITSGSERDLITRALSCMALVERNRAMVDIGAYQSGSNPQLDAALRTMQGLEDFLRQDAAEYSSRTDSLARLETLLRTMDVRT